jgi:hypothetical protein
VVHVGDRSKMDHGVAALARGGDRLEVGEVAEVGVDRPGGVVRRGDDVEDPRRQPTLDQLVDDV